MSTLRLAIVVTVVTSCFAMSLSSQNRPLCSLSPEEMVHKVLSLGTVSRDRLVLLGMQDTSLDLYTVQLNSTRLMLPSSNVSLANTLGISPEFRRHKDSIMNSAASFSNRSGYFLFSLNVREMEQPGVIDILMFNVTSKQLTRQDWHFDVALEGIDGEASVWIATMPPFLFVLLKDRYNGWLIAKVAINLKLRKFELIGQMLRLCMYGEPEQLYGVFLTDRASHCKNPYDWPVVTGVHYSGRFYLFGEKQVHIFSDKVFQGVKQAEPHPISSLKYSSFIACPSGTAKHVTLKKSQLADNGTGTGPSQMNQSNRALCILILFLLFFALIVVCVIGCGRVSDSATPQQAPLKQQAFTEQHAEEAKLFLEETPQKSQIGGSIVLMERSRSRSGSRSHRRANSSLTGSKVGKAKSLVKGDNSHQAKKATFENPADFFADY